MIGKLFKYKIRDVRSYIMMGMIMATVYAEYFSIFYKVSVLALLVLVVIFVAAIVLFFKDIKEHAIAHRDHFRNSVRVMRISALILLLISLCAIFDAAYISSKEVNPASYDTINYHIPSIRWISEYGVVKGLANLHSRFAYNSSFLCLQALFSFRNILGYSLHSVNGYIWAFMWLSTLFGLWIMRYKRFTLSDLLRLLFMVILMEQMKSINNPVTDFWPMCITAYVFIEWCDLVERREEDPAPYGLIAMVGLFSASVKLSSAILFLFALKPVAEYIRTKKGGMIVKFAVTGIFLLLPFMIRNVILCGYILYPVAAVDLFDFDWEVPKSVIISEKIGIEIFARAWGADNGYVDWSESFGQWFKIWIQYSSGYYGMLGISNFILSIVVLAYTTFKSLEKKLFTYGVMTPYVSCIGYLFILFTAPAVRFGRWWFLSLPLITLYYIARRIYIGYSMERSTSTHPIYEIADRRGHIYFWGLVLIFSVDILAALVIKDLEHHTPAWIEERLVRPEDYSMNGKSGQYYDINGYRFYYYLPDPAGVNCLNGYDGFPGTECLATLTRIEMRGKSLADGFRPKAECRNIPYDGLGNVIATEYLESMGLDKYYNGEYTDNYADAVCAAKETEDFPGFDFACDLVCETTVDETDDAGIRTVCGWAYVPGEKGPENGDIYLRCGNDYYKCDETVCYDVAESIGDRGARIGFAVYTHEKGEVQICIVDKEDGTIHLAR